ncbi:MAG: hypothetical protein ACFCGT_17335 [Sandaracinaceae bacterium]
MSGAGARETETPATAAVIADALRQAGAEEALLAWLLAQGDLESAIATCPRGDWLLRIALAAGTDRMALVRAACACARFAGAYLTEADEARASAAVSAAEAAADHDGEDGRGLAAREAELVQALDEREDPAARAALISALAAVRAVRDAAEAPRSSTAAIEATVADAGDCAVEAALAYAERSTAERVRRALGWASKDSGRR